MQCKLRCGTQVRRSEKVFVIFSVFLFCFWKCGAEDEDEEDVLWQMLQIERGEEGGRPCSELLNGAPPAPVRTTGQQIQLSPKQRNIFDGLQEINHPQGTTMPRMKIWETKWFCMCSNAQVTIHLFLNYCQWDSSLIPPFIIDNLFGKVP